MKICKICKVKRPRNEFYNSSRHKDGILHHCKLCSLKRRVEYLTNQIKSSFVNAFQRECKTCKKVLNLDSFLTKSLNCKSCRSAKQMTPERIKYKQEYHKRVSKSAVFKEKKKAQKRAWRLKRSPEQKQRDYLYNLEYSRRSAQIRNQRIKERRRIDQTFRLTKVLRSSFAMAIRKGYKTGSSLKLLGCSLAYFKKWIALQFQDNMFWWNWGHGIGKWNLDHIIPISLFDLSNPEEQRKCFHYTNFRPLWHSENGRKSDKLSDGSKARFVRDKNYEERMSLANDIWKVL